MTQLSSPPPTAPSRTNWLGTDDRGRDVLVRLICGFGVSMRFAILSTFGILILGYTIGGALGYFGGTIDLVGLRVTEAWDALPVLCLVLFFTSLGYSGALFIGVIWIAIGWTRIASYVRMEVIRLKNTEFVRAAHAMGASPMRILFREILPNALTPALCFTPLLVASSIGGLAALDYLGFGLPPPTPSLGELLRQGRENLSCWWLVAFPIGSLFVTLWLLHLIGEAAREATREKI